MAGQRLNEIKAVWRNRRESLSSQNHFRTCPLLNDSTFRPVFLQLPVNIRYGLYIPPPSNTISKQDETSGPVELLRGTSDVAVRYPPSCTQIGWMMPLFRGCFPLRKLTKGTVEVDAMICLTLRLGFMNTQGFASLPPLSSIAVAPDTFCTLIIHITSYYHLFLRQY